jgi:F-type H+-transporting ATPase subunit b
MIDIDWTLFAQLINFLLLVFLLNLVLFRPIRKALQDRQARLAQEEAAASQLELESQGLSAEIKEKLAAARWGRPAGGLEAGRVPGGSRPAGGSQKAGGPGMGAGGEKNQSRHGQGPGVFKETGSGLCSTFGRQSPGEGALMKAKQAFGWLKAAAAFLGLSAGVLLAGVAAASEAAHGGGHGGISPEKIQDMIWRTVNFVVFAGILIKLVAKPAKNFFGKRSQDVAQSLEDLEAKRAAAQAAVKEAEARLAEVAKERESIIQQYLAEGQNEKAKILDKANAVAERIKEMARVSIEQETKKAAQSLKEEVVDQATQLATDLIKKKATSADQQGLVEEYLKKVVKTH